MNDAKSSPPSPPSPQMTCPNCGASQPRAERCRDCGTIISRRPARRVLKGRERALAAARSGGSRRSGYLHWSALLVYSLAIGVVAVLVHRQWSEGSGTENPSAATVAASVGTQYPQLADLERTDPEVFSQLLGEISQSLESGSSETEAMAQAVAVLRQVMRERDSQPLAPGALDEAAVPNLVSEPGSDWVDLGSVGDRIGVSRLKTRRCSGDGPDAECIEQFDDLGSVNGRPMDEASAQERVEAFRRKKEEYYKALEEL